MAYRPSATSRWAWFNSARYHRDPANQANVGNRRTIASPTNHQSQRLRRRGRLAIGSSGVSLASIDVDELVDIDERQAKIGQVESAP